MRQLLILGGGISGVESALYAREAGLDVTLVEKMGHIIPRQVGRTPFWARRNEGAR